MKLNMELFREVLLFLENQKYFTENETGGVESTPINIETIYNHFPKIPKEEVLYTLTNLNDAGYITLSISWASGIVYSGYVNKITFAGHEFIASVKNNEHWKGILKALPSIRNFSLDAIKAVSDGITTAAINSYIQKNISNL